MERPVRLSQLGQKGLVRTYPWPLAALRELVTTEQILFGSDYPFQPVETTTSGLPNGRFTDAELAAVLRGNAERLFPRLAG